MRRVTRSFLFFLGCWCIVSCTTTGHPLEPRETYWTTELSQFFSEPREVAELESWLTQKGVENKLGRKGTFGNKWTVALEKLEVDSTVCESWELDLIVFVSDDSRISNHSLKREGNCL